MIKFSKRCKVIVASATAVAVITPFFYAYKAASAYASVNAGANIRYLSSHDQAIEDAKKETEKYEALAEEAKKQWEADKAEYDSIVEYIEMLDEKQGEIAKQIGDLTVAIAEIEKEKEETAEKLEEAQKVRDEQYEKMSARIKYIYENGETDYLDILLNAGNLSDLLNRVEYVSEISEYDDELFNEFVNAAKEVKEYSDLLDAQEEKMTAAKKSYDAFYDLTEVILEEKNEALDDAAEKMGVSREVYEEYVAEVEAGRMNWNQAVKAKEEEEKKAQQSTVTVPTTNPSLNGTGSGGLSSVTQTENTNIGDIIWPLPGYGNITSYFGYRTSPTAGASSNHKGIDISAPFGTPVIAALAGTVIASSEGWAEGKYVIIDHGNGYKTLYMHMSQRNCVSGQHVSQGQVIGYVGSTGISTGNHLHFAVTVNNVYQNPLSYVAY